MTSNGWKRIPRARGAANLEFRITAMSELTAKHVLVDLFGSGHFPAEILDPEHAAEIVISAADRCWLRDHSAIGIPMTEAGN